MVLIATVDGGFGQEADMRASCVSMHWTQEAPWSPRPSPTPTAPAARAARAEA
ncbi:hypothetical protein PLESTM_000134400 [Pleodorina starrii]|nr:hypothetical protein PLESTM_000134400 [Pleodorina starrii]